MFKFKKSLKYSFLIVVMSWCSLSNCMIESLSYGIFAGEIDSVESAITVGENVNEIVYCEELKSFVLPLILAIKCFSKVKSGDIVGLIRRIAIVELLIKKGAIINKEAYDAVNLLKSITAKLALKKLFDSYLVDEFLGIADAIETERNNLSQSNEGILEEDDFLELVEDDKDEKNALPILKNTQDNLIFTLVEDYEAN